MSGACVKLFMAICLSSLFVLSNMDILIHNAKIWRSGLRYYKDKRQFYDWMLFNTDSGKIKSCGGSEDRIPEQQDVKRIDLCGKWVLPGFHDSHLHVTLHGKLLVEHKNLKVPKTIAEMQERLKVLLVDPRNAPEEGNTWFMGSGFEQHPLGRYPTSEDLDEVTTTRPLFIYHSSLHIAILNTLGMKMGGVYDKPPSSDIEVYPPGHKMAGKRTGIVKELALDDVKAKIPRSSKLIKDTVTSALDDCVRLGITSLHTMEADCWKEYVELAEEGRIPIQCFFSTHYPDLKGSNRPVKAGESHKNILKCRCVKVFADGALGSDTAALSLPYKKKNPDGSDNYGTLCYTQEELDAIVKEVDGQGFQLEIHVIGDKATESVVIALEKASITSDKRTLLVHSQMIRKDLIPRMAKLGVVSTVQPQMIPDDARWMRDTLPEPLLDCVFPFRSMIEGGVICAGSSDSPVCYPNCLQGMHDAIFQPDCEEVQKSLGKVSGFNEQRRAQKSFQPKECVTFTQAVDMYTSEAAKTDFAEGYLGRLEPSYYANFTVLKLPMVNGEQVDISQHPEYLPDTKVIQTWSRGVKLFDEAE